MTTAGSQVQGVRDGAASIRVSLGKWTANISATIRDFTVSPPVHFDNDVVPILSKLGCNSGGCHGKASGQNGFKLSVFGFDPEADYNAIVKESRSRRVFPAAPEHSLLLLKPTGKISHGGGRRLEAGSADYLLLRDWLTQGMPVGQSNGPRLIAIRVSPTERHYRRSRHEQQILATGIFSDGSRRDVTWAATYTSNAEHVAAVDGHGLVQIGSIPGEAAITVNYMGQVAAVRLQVPRPDAPHPYPNLPANNKIDELVWAKLKTMGIVPSELTGDAAFLRALRMSMFWAHSPGLTRSARFWPMGRRASAPIGSTRSSNVLNTPIIGRCNGLTSSWSIATSWATAARLSCIAGCARKWPAIVLMTSGCAN